MLLVQCSLPTLGTGGLCEGPFSPYRECGATHAKGTKPPERKRKCGATNPPDPQSCVVSKDDSKIPVIVDRIRALERTQEVPACAHLLLDAVQPLCSLSLQQWWQVQSARRVGLPVSRQVPEIRCRERPMSSMGPAEVRLMAESR